MALQAEPHGHRSSSGLEYVPNFRCLSRASAIVQPARVYRSATPANASHDVSVDPALGLRPSPCTLVVQRCDAPVWVCVQDVDRLIKQLGIRTIIDLRDAGEAKNDDGSCIVLSSTRP